MLFTTGGRWWIRTTEVIDDRFTVRLCHSLHVSYNTVLLYLVICHIEKLFSKAMLTNTASYYCVLLCIIFILFHPRSCLSFDMTEKWQKNPFPCSLCYGFLTSIRLRDNIDESASSGLLRSVRMFYFLTSYKIHSPAFTRGMQISNANFPSRTLVSSVPLLRKAISRMLGSPRPCADLSALVVDRSANNSSFKTFPLAV